MFRAPLTKRPSKECLIVEDDVFYLFYNAKDEGKPRWTEQTGLATSRDLVSWTRHPDNPLIRVKLGAWDSGFCSDPCVVRSGEERMMVYFGNNYRHAQNGIALSDDLVTWRKHPEPILPAGSPGELDSIP